MSGLAYDLVPQGDAPDELQAGVSRYVERPDGEIDHYIGNENGRPVLVSGHGRVLFAGEVHVFKDSSNSREVYCDALDLADISYRYSEPDYYFCRVQFNNGVPNSAKARAEVYRISQWNDNRDFSKRYAHMFRPPGDQMNIYAFEAGAESSFIIDPGEFHAYVKILQF
jgi:hypothetical protein